MNSLYTATVLRNCLVQAQVLTSFYYYFPGKTLRKDSVSLHWRWSLHHMFFVLTGEKKGKDILQRQSALIIWGHEERVLMGAKTMQVFTMSISHKSQNNLFNASHSVNIRWKIATLKIPLYLLSFANCSEHLKGKQWLLNPGLLPKGRLSTEARSQKEQPENGSSIK